MKAHLTFADGAKLARRLAPTVICLQPKSTARLAGRGAIPDMLDAYLMEWGGMLLRWLHVITAIA